MTRRRPVAGIAVAIAAAALALAVAASATVPQAAQRVRAAIPAAAFYKEEHGTYAGMTLAKLRSIDRSIRNVAVKRAGKSAYCLQSTLPGPVVHFDGPNGRVRRGPCGVRGAVVPSPAPAPPADPVRDLRAAVPAIEVYRMEHSGYAGLTLARIQAIDAGIRGIRVVWAASTAYCIESAGGTHHARSGLSPAIGRCPGAP